MQLNNHHFPQESFKNASINITTSSDTSFFLHSHHYWLHLYKKVVSCSFKTIDEPLPLLFVCELIKIIMHCRVMTFNGIQSVPCGLFTTGSLTKLGKLQLFFLNILLASNLSHWLQETLSKGVKNLKIFSLIYRRMSTEIHKKGKKSASNYWQHFYCQERKREKDGERNRSASIHEYVIYVFPKYWTSCAVLKC